MTNKALIAVVGPSGSGKSSSLEHLDPKTTKIIDLERKGFPFRNVSQFDILPAENPKQFDDQLAKCLADQSVDLIIIESFTKYAEQVKTLCQTVYKGYEIYGNYAKIIRGMLNKVKNSHAVVAMTAIDEIIAIPNVDGTETAKRLISVDGKELKGKIEYDFLMVFFTEPRKTKDGKMEYFFQTNTDGITSAKSPKLMFEQQLIPNDLAAVLKRAKEYYQEGKA